MRYLAFLLVFLYFDASACVKRSQMAKREFVKAHACPSTGLHKRPCPGYVIDHTVALACGGRDSPINMQWQTVADGKAKDKIERIGCKNGKRVK